MRDYFKQRSWPLFLTLVLAIVYLMLFLIKGYFPFVDRIILFRSSDQPLWGLPTNFSLPFSFYSWLDIPLIFIVSSMFFYYLKYRQRRQSGAYLPRHFFDRFGTGLWFGLSFGLLFSLIPAPAVGLYFGLLFGLLVAFAAALFFESWSDIGVVFGAGSGFGLMFCISFGLQALLGLNLLFGIIAAIAYAVIYALFFLCLTLIFKGIRKIVDFTFSNEPLEINFPRHWKKRA